MPLNSLPSRVELLELQPVRLAVEQVGRAGSRRAACRSRTAARSVWRSRKQYAWIVPTKSCPSWSIASSPSRAVTRCRMRSFSSAAAFSVNVNATIDAGSSPVGQQGGHPLRDDLGLARAGRRDDLHVAAAVGDRVGGLALEDGDLGSIVHAIHGRSVPGGCPVSRGFAGRIHTSNSAGTLRNNRPHSPARPLRDGRMIRAEAAGNAYLLPQYRLGEDGCAFFTATGWPGNDVDGGIGDRNWYVERFLADVSVVVQQVTRWR